MDIITPGNNPVKTNHEILENFHAEMRRQFQEMYLAHRPTLRELQAQEQQKAIERIKNILFAKVLVRMIRNYSLVGNSEPLIVNLQALLEAL